LISTFSNERIFVQKSNTLLCLLFFIVSVGFVSARAQTPALVEAADPIQLNINLSAGKDVIDFKISPNGEQVVYIADQNQDDVYELFSANIDGSGTPIKLNGPAPVLGGDILNIVGFSADGSKVVYIADQELDERQDIYSVNLNGSSRVRLFAGPRTIPQAEVGPNGNRVVYILNVGGGFDQAHDIYSSPISGGTAALLSDRNSDPLQVLDFRFSSDGSKVVFRGKLFIVQQLNIANIDGSGLAKRVDVDREADGGASIFANYQISEDNNYVVYLADKNAVALIELFSSNLSSGEVIRLNSTLPDGGLITDFRLDIRNSSFVYYIPIKQVASREEVLRVGINGGKSVRISPPTLGNSNAGFLVSRENRGSLITYRFTDRSSTTRVSTLRAIDQNTNSDILVSETTAVSDLAFVEESFSGEFVTFLARDFGEPARRIFSLRLGENVTNNRVLISESDTTTLPTYVREISNDDRIVLYEANDRNDQSLQNIFASSLTQGKPVRINPDLPSGAEIKSPTLSDGGEYAVYISDQNNVGVFNLYSSEITINDDISDLCVPVKANNGFAVICL